MVQSGIHRLVEDGLLPSSVRSEENQHDRKVGRNLPSPESACTEHPSAAYYPAVMSFPYGLGGAPVSYAFGSDPFAGQVRDLGTALTRPEGYDLQSSVASFPSAIMMSNSGCAGSWNR